MGVNVLKVVVKQNIFDPYINTWHLLVYYTMRDSSLLYGIIVFYNVDIEGLSIRPNLCGYIQLKFKAGLSWNKV